MKLSLKQSSVPMKSFVWQADVVIIVGDDEQGNDDVVNSDAYPVTETSPVNSRTEESDEYVTQEYIPDKTEIDQPSSNYAEESESNYVAPEDIQYNDQGEALEWKPSKNTIHCFFRL